jgi:acyl-CoA thioester hydrolase
MRETPGSLFFFAPFVSSTMRVEPGWMDYNGHLAAAYYHDLFERASHEAFGIIGLGPGYLEQRKASFFVAESHVRYLRELVSEDKVRVTVQLLGFDDKRLHVHMDMRHSIDGWVAATCESLSLHVDAATRRSCPFPDDIRANLAIMKASHARLLKPTSLGRSISLSRKPDIEEPLMSEGTLH